QQAIREENTRSNNGPSFTVAEDHAAVEERLIDAAAVLIRTNAVIVPHEIAAEELKIIDRSVAANSDAVVAEVAVREPRVIIVNEQTYIVGVKMRLRDVRIAVALAADDGPPEVAEFER